jgi:hypothetical protein
MLHAHSLHQLFLLLDIIWASTVAGTEKVNFKAIQHVSLGVSIRINKQVALKE